MKFYYYFLFRVYRLYKDKSHETDSQAVFSVTAVSTVILCFFILSLYGVANYLGFRPLFTEKSTTIVFVVVVGIINYFFIIRKKKFLNFNFEKDARGGLLIVLILVLLAAFFIVISNFNRERIFRENKDSKSNQPRKESLEGKIRKWFE